MKIRQKLILGFLTVFILILVLGYICVINSRETIRMFTKTETDIVPGAVTMMEMDTFSKEIEHLVLHYIIYGKSRDNLQEIMQKLKESGLKHLEHETHIGLEEQKAARELNLIIEKVISLSAEIISLKDQGTAVDELMKKDSEEFDPLEVVLSGLLMKHKAVHIEELRKAGEDIYQKMNRGIKVVIITIIFMLILAISIAIFISQSISNSVTKLKTAAVEIGKGKLDTRAMIKSKDEIGELANAFNNMAEELQQSYKDIQKKQEELGEMNEELTSTNEELTSTNEELMQTNEELEATTEELRLSNEEMIKAKETAEKKTEEMERFHKVAVDRELKMRELKERIRELEGKSEDQGAGSNGNG